MDCLGFACAVCALTTPGFIVLSMQAASSAACLSGGSIVRSVATSEGSESDAVVCDCAILQFWSALGNLRLLHLGWVRSRSRVPAWRGESARARARRDSCLIKNLS